MWNSVVNIAKKKKQHKTLCLFCNNYINANRILAASLTPNILRDKGIEATLKLAQSNNSKVVVVGSGDDGLPLILGNN